MEAFIQILEKIAQVEVIVKKNEDLDVIITLRSATTNLLGLRCKS